MISFGSARKLNSYLVRANLYPAERTVGSFRSSYSEVFLGKGAVKTCSKFTGEHPCRSVTSIKVICNIIEVTLQHGCSPVNLLHIFRVPFYKKTYGRQLLRVVRIKIFCFYKNSRLQRQCYF